MDRLDHSGKKCWGARKHSPTECSDARSRFSGESSPAPLTPSCSTRSCFARSQDCSTGKSGPRGAFLGWAFLPLEWSPGDLGPPARCPCVNEFSTSGLRLLWANPRRLSGQVPSAFYSIETFQMPKVSSWQSQQQVQLALVVRQEASDSAHSWWGMVWSEVVRLSFCSAFGMPLPGNRWWRARSMQQPCWCLLRGLQRGSRLPQEPHQHGGRERGAETESGAPLGSGSASLVDVTPWRGDLDRRCKAGGGEGAREKPRGAGRALGLSVGERELSAYEPPSPCIM